MKELNDYKKYKWFYTSSEKLVVGGKSAIQNDELLKRIKSEKRNFVVMHTELPGSPFSVILADEKNVNKSDLEECAVFTACFSKAWKNRKTSATVHIFSSKQVHKDQRMNKGTWAVLGKVQKKEVELVLVLAKQKGILRAIPEKTAKVKKEILLKICPGRITKEEMAAKLAVEIGNQFSESEIISALPAGGVQVWRRL